VSEWTVDTLKVHYDTVLAEKDKAINAALEAAEKAVTKAEAASERRFEGVNEFRAALSDQTQTFIPRSEYSSAADSVERRLRLLEAAVSAWGGRSTGLDAGWGYLLGGLGAVGTVVGVMLAVTS
jgi:hypothetical protein